MPIKPRLNTFDLTMIVISVVIGTGIFRTPVEIAQKAELPSIFFTAWIAGAIISLFGALTLAEVGSRYPAAGGFYKIFSHCYHPAFAFMVNWISIIANAGSSASVAIIGSAYIAPLLFPTLDSELGTRITTLSAVGLLYVINMLGIKMGSRALNILMIIKIAMLILLISTAFLSSEPATEVPKELSQKDSFKAFWLCFVPIFFTYGGYHQTMNFGHDVPNASKVIPKSIFIGMGAVLVLYLFVNYSYVKVLGFEGLKNSPALAADMTARIFGNAASTVVSVIMFLAVLAYVNASLLSNPRVYYAMAQENVLPAIFKTVNQKTQTQELALTVYTAIIVLFLFALSSLQKILSYVMFFDSIGLIAACSAVFILRRREKLSGQEDKGIYRMKLYPWLTLIFILGYALVNFSVMYFEPQTALIGLFLFLLGLPMYYLLVRFFRK